MMGDVNGVATCADVPHDTKLQELPEQYLAKDGE